MKKNILLFILFLFVCIQSALSQTYIISTIAGDPRYGYAGFNGLATKAQLFDPISVAADDSGNVYISDGFIKKVNKQGIITEYAGGGANSYATVGPAVNSEIVQPQGIAFDRSDNLYIAQLTYPCIRKINKFGIVSCVAGDSVMGSSGDGGPATAAELGLPVDVAPDPMGNLYIIDGNVVRMVNSAGIISNFAGNGAVGFYGDGGPATAAEFYGMQSVATDTIGNLYIADQVDNRIRKVNTAGIVTTVVGTATSGYSGDGGPASAAELAYPVCVRFDKKNNMYLWDQDGIILRKVDTAGIITTVGGQDIQGYCGDGGPATAAEFAYARGISVDKSGNIYVADAQNARVRRIDKGDSIFNFAGWGSSMYFWGDSGRADSAELHEPTGVAINKKGEIFISDGDNNRIRKINTGDTITTIAGKYIFGLNGNGGPDTASTVYYPQQISLDTTGNIFFADELNEEIREINTAGIISNKAGSWYGNFGWGGDHGLATNALLFQPCGVTVDDTGNIFIADTYNDVISKVNTSGIITTISGFPGIQGYTGDYQPATDAEFNLPSSIAVDKKGNIYIADQSNNVVRKITPTDSIFTIAGGGTSFADGVPATAAILNSPRGILTDTAGNIYISDFDADRIRRVNKQGIITTIAGSANYVLPNLGDGYLAAYGNLQGPMNMCIDSKNNIYVADMNNNRIRKLTYYAVAFSASDSIFCAPQTIQFKDKSIDNPTSWHWTFQGGTPATSTLQNPTVTYPVAGNYMVKLAVTTPNGPDSVTVNAFLLALQTPTISITSSSDTSCNGQSVLLKASGAWGYVWSNSAYGDTVTVVPLVTTTYSVTATALNGCSATDSIKIVGNYCAGIQEITNDPAISLYPNPAKNRITVEVNGYSGKQTTLTVYDVLGEKVLVSSLISGNNDINVSQLAAGLYLYKICKQDGTGLANGKISIE